MAITCKKILFITSVFLLSGCGSEPSTPDNNASELSHVYTYQPQTLIEPLRDPASCVNYTYSCNVQALPFIAINTPAPDIADVMARVVVSHDWMGARFEALLAELPSEILTLLGSVTAVVIADNIRPSFYWTGSGAIYLDPADLWLTNAEKQTIQQKTDYRSAFASELSYDFFHRFTKKGQAAYRYYPLTGNQERSIDDIIVPMASLLFHELAHANDFMPAWLMASLNLENSTWSEINRLSNQRLNRKLQQQYPLNDATLISQAAVLYLGQVATEAQKLESAEDLGFLMAQEGANHLYAYSHQAEDVAMLFQATMLNYSYGVEMDSAFVIQPEIDNGNCNDYLVAWGQRNRIADPITEPRARFVSQQLLPEIDFNAFFDQIEAVQTFPALTTWCNIGLTETVTTISSKIITEQYKPLIKEHHHGVRIQ